MFNNFLRYGRVVYILAILLSVCIFLFYIGLGKKVKTDILDLIPSQKSNWAVELAQDNFVSNLSRQIVIVLKDKSPSEAIRSADALGSLLQKQENFFERVDYRINDEFTKDFYDLFFPYRWLLLIGENRNIALLNNPEVIIDSALARLYSPVLGVSGEYILKDPFFLFMEFATSVPRLSGSFSVQDEYLVHETPNDAYVLINATIKDEKISDTELTFAIDKAKEKIEKEFKNTQVFWTGMPKFAAAAQQKAQMEISLIGMGSILGIVLLFLISFGSLRQLVIALVPILMGFLIAWAVTASIFGEIHVFTLVFGASLIGVCIDYSFHYFAHGHIVHSQSSRDNLLHILPGITMGMLTSAAGYLALMIAPFPGLRQMSVFAASGLMGAYFTVVFLFSVLPAAKGRTSRPLLFKAASGYIEFVSKKRSIIIKGAFIIGTIALAGIFFVDTDDDIRLLRGENIELEEEEKRISDLLGKVDKSRFVVVTGDDEETLLKNEREFALKLDVLKRQEALDNYVAVSGLIPTFKEQEQNAAFFQKLVLDKNADDYFSILDLDDSFRKELAANISKISPVGFEEIKNRPSLSFYRSLWQGKSEQGWSSVIMLEGINKAEDIITLTDKYDFAHYSDRVEQISNLFRSYRYISSWLVLLAYTVIAFFLVYRYGIKKGIWVMLPPFLSTIIVIGAMGYAGVSINIFTFLGFLLVLAIGIDYTLFFAESKDHDKATAFAILLSSITTILSFGLLSLGSTPAIVSLGTTIFAGIILSALLSPLSRCSK